MKESQKIKLPRHFAEPVVSLSKGYIPRNDNINHKKTLQIAGLIFQKTEITQR